MRAYVKAQSVCGKRKVEIDYAVLKRMRRRGCRVQNVKGILRGEGIEPTTAGSGIQCSTTELSPQYTTLQQPQTTNHTNTQKQQPTRPLHHDNHKARPPTIHHTIEPAPSAPPSKASTPLIYHTKLHTHRSRLLVRDTICNDHCTTRLLTS